MAKYKVSYPLERVNEPVAVEAPMSGDYCPSIHLDLSKEAAEGLQIDQDLEVTIRGTVEEVGKWEQSQYHIRLKLEEVELERENAFEKMSREND